ncbi:MAG: primase-helicase family protein [Puniceicoccales bacterium]
MPIANITSAIGAQDKTAEPFIFFENRTSKFWIRDVKDAYRPYSENKAKIVLLEVHGVGRGITDAKLREQELSGHLNRAVVENGFDFPLAISGHTKGLHEINGKHVLVPNEPDLVKPIAGEWTVIKTIWKSALGDEQFEWFYWWLASTLQGLHVGVWVPAPVVAFIGETGSCKSLTQSILTKVLGDREARVIQAITGGTGFNGDWAEATHLMVEDDFSENSKAIRQKIKESIKSVAVNERHRIHPKGAQAFSICPFWRMSISCNPVEESLAVLPEIDNTVDKKLALLWFSRATMPMPSDSAETRKALWGAIIKELPAMVHEMLNAGAVPKAHRDTEGRCTVKAYHHPNSLESVFSLSDDGQWFNEFCEIIPTPWEGTAQEAHAALKDAGASYIKGTKAIGRLMTRLCETHKRHVKCMGKPHSNLNRYRITSPAQIYP